MDNQTTQNLKSLWQSFLNISKIIFEISLILYLALFLIEEISKGAISNFFNTNYLLVVCIIFGAITAFAQKEPLDKLEAEKIPQPLKKWDYVLMVSLGILAIIVVFFKIKEIGLALAVPISILSGVLIFLISWLFLKGEDKENKEEV